MRIAILGSGPIGCYITACFASTLHELYLLGRSTIAAIEANGILVEDQVSKTAYKVDRSRLHIESDMRKILVCDVIIIATKSHHNTSEFLAGLASICSAQTAVITLQNGWEFEGPLQRAIPSTPLFSGTCWIKVSQREPGVISHDLGDSIQVARYQPDSAPKGFAEAGTILQALFRIAGINLELVSNSQSVQLSKLALNVPLCALMAEYGYSVPEVFDKVNAEREDLQNEIVEAAGKAGFSIDLCHVMVFIDYLSKMPLSSPPSRREHANNMKKDLSLGAWVLLDWMKNKNVVMPLLERYHRKLTCPDEAAPGF